MSKMLHVISVIVGFSGIVTAFIGVSAGANDLIWGLTREHILFCSGLLMLFAIWFEVGTIHHMFLEKEGRII